MNFSKIKSLPRDINSSENENPSISFAFQEGERLIADDYVPLIIFNLPFHFDVYIFLPAFNVFPLFPRCKAQFFIVAEKKT
jgi:hypothetical protein